MVDPYSNVVGLKPAGGFNKGDQQDSCAIFQGLSKEVPPCPKWLSKDARAHYRFIVNELKVAGLIAKIDQGALSILCTSYAGMKQAEEELQQHGEFQETPNGYMQLSPYAVSWERHSSKYEKLAKQFGITIRGRQSIKIENPDQGSLDL